MPEFVIRDVIFVTVLIAPEPLASNCGRGTSAALNEERFQMAYVVTDACIKDFVCVPECTTAAIAPSASDPAAATVSQVYINPDECIDCGNCASVCEQNAIYVLDELPADKSAFAGKNKDYFN
jgi:ferredoxin